MSGVAPATGAVRAARGGRSRAPRDSAWRSPCRAYGTSPAACGQTPQRCPHPGILGDNHRRRGAGRPRPGLPPHPGGGLPVEITVTNTRLTPGFAGGPPLLRAAPDRRPGRANAGAQGGARFRQGGPGAGAVRDRHPELGERAFAHYDVADLVWPSFDARRPPWGSDHGAPAIHRSAAGWYVEGGRTASRSPGHRPRSSIPSRWRSRGPGRARSGAAPD